MRVHTFLDSVLAICTAVMVFSGCSGQEVNTTPPVAISPIFVKERSATKSWIAPSAAQHNLLYVAALSKSRDGIAYVYTYPHGRLVGTLTGFGAPSGECSDSAGNVFIVTYTNTSRTSSTIYEFAHGGTNPIATLSDPDVADGCAVDPTTGNLAASGQGVAIFKNASGTPTIYSSSRFIEFFNCGYDDKGNLYISADDVHYAERADLVRLASGSSTFEQINLDTKVYWDNDYGPSVQWDGKHIAVSSWLYRKPILLYRLRISGNNGKVIGSATLTSRSRYYSGDNWIQGTSIIGLGDDRRDFQDALLWPYPKGGEPQHIIEKLGMTRHLEVSAVTVSVAASR